MRLLILDRTLSVPNVIHLEDVKSLLKEVLFKGDVFSSHKLHREQLVVPTVSPNWAKPLLMKHCLSVCTCWGMVRGEASRFFEC